MEDVPIIKEFETISKFTNISLWGENITRTKVT